MRDFIAVALGGMLGSVARHAANVGLSRFATTSSWPIATLLVNLVGCFGIGLLAAAAKRWQWLDTPWELAVRIGVLGGLTTFSSFGLEVVRLWQADRPLAAGTVVAANVILGIGAVLLGEFTLRWFAR
jgi:fluoride exporter